MTANHTLVGVESDRAGPVRRRDEMKPTRPANADHGETHKNKESTMQRTLVTPTLPGIARTILQLGLPTLVIAVTACDRDPIQPGPAQVTEHLAFAKGDSPYKGQVLVTSASATSAHILMVDPVTKNSVTVGTLPDDYFYGSWSPDYTRIAFGKNHWDGLHIMNADGSGETHVVLGIWVDAMAFSPDGDRIAYIGKEPGNGGIRQLYIVDIASKQPTVLTNMNNIGLRVSWSPDGKKILFHQDNGSGWNLHTIAPDGTGLTQLTHCANVACYDGQYSPDGKQIAFIHGGQIARMTAAGAKMQMLTSAGDPQPYWPSWSPDGKQMAYERAVGSHQRDIWVLTIANGNTAPLVTGRLDDVTPNWSR